MKPQHYIGMLAAVILACRLGAAPRENSSLPSTESIPSPSPTAPRAVPDSAAADGLTLIRSLKGPSAASSLAFSPDGSLLATGHQDGTVILWDMPRGVEVSSETLHASSVGLLRFSEGAASLVTVGVDGLVIILHPNGGSSTDLEPDGSILPLAISSDGGVLAYWAVNNGPLIELLDLQNRVVTQMLHEDEVTSFWVRNASFSPDGRILASIPSDRTITLWDTTTGNQLRRLPRPEAGIVIATFSPDSNTLAAGGMQGEVQLWDMASGLPRLDLQKRSDLPEDPIMHLAFSNDGSTLAVEHHGILLLDTTTGAELRALRDGTTTPAFSPVSDILAAIMPSGEVGLWEIEP